MKIFWEGRQKLLVCRCLYFAGDWRTFRSNPNPDSRREIERTLLECLASVDEITREIAAGFDAQDSASIDVLRRAQSEDCWTLPLKILSPPTAIVPQIRSVPDSLGNIFFSLRVYIAMTLVTNFRTSVIQETNREENELRWLRCWSQ
jgi:hypothetical protein